MNCKSIALTLLLLVASVAFAADAPRYALSRHLAVGGEGGWDYITYDADGGRLFVTRGAHVLVLDAVSGKQLADIPDTAGVHGVAIAPELGVGFITAGKAAAVIAFDLKSYAVVANIPAGVGPDAILYDAASGLVFAFNGKSHDATVIDAAKRAVVGKIDLAGKPETGVSDGAGHMYVNIEDKGEIAEVDIKSLAVTRRFALPGCEEPSGLAIDRKHQRLFSVCSSKKMEIVNYVKGAIVAEPPIGASPDAVVFDAEQQLAFSSNGEGSITVVQELAPDKFVVAQTVATERGAKTIALDATHHRLYLPTAKFAPAAAPTAARPHPRPQPIAGSFVILEVSQQ